MAYPPFAYPLLREVDFGVPQACVRARASSATLCSVHVLRVFLCMFYIKKGIWYVSNGLGYMSATYPNPYPPCHCTPLMTILNFKAGPQSTQVWFCFVRNVGVRVLDSCSWPGGFRKTCRATLSAAGADSAEDATSSNNSQEPSVGSRSGILSGRAEAAERAQNADFHRKPQTSADSPLNAHSSTPAPPRGRKLRPRSEKNSDQNPDHPRLCMKTRERRNSDHGLSFWGVFGVGVDEGVSTPSPGISSVWRAQETADCQSLGSFAFSELQAHRVSPLLSRSKDNHPQREHTNLGVFVRNVHWRVPNPPCANPLVAERAFPTSDYWGCTGVARCAEEMTGICRDFQ